MALAEANIELEPEAVEVQEIEALQALGINASDINKLRAAGVFTIGGALMTQRKDLMAIKGLSEAKVAKILEAAGRLAQHGFVPASTVLHRRKQVLRVSTGSQALDELLGGGVESQSITEAFGEFRTGKTQLCHTMCVTAQMGEHAGGVIYIDTEGTFRPERLEPICARFGLDYEETLNNIKYCRVYTHDQQMEALIGCAAQMMEQTHSVIIVDSLTALFRADFSGRGQLAARQQTLQQFLNRLMKLSCDFNVAAFITNQVVADPGGAMFVGDIKKPIGGHVVAHASTTRLYLRKGRGEQRICKIYDSPCLPESEAMYALGPDGVVDATD